MTQSAELVKGQGFAKIGGNKPIKNPDKLMKLGGRVSKSLRSNATTSKMQSAETWKALQASPISQFLQAFNGMPQNSAYTQLAEAFNSLAADMGKTIALAAPLASGLVPFDLLAPSRLIYPVYSPLRNKLPRTQGQGTSRRVKVFTGVSGSHTGGQGVANFFIPEFPGGGGLGAANWPNQLPAAGAQTAVDVNIPYRFAGITEALSWLAQFAGQGFEDISALANLILLQEMMLAEEHALLEASHQNLVVPNAPSGTAKAAATGEVAITGPVSGQNVYVKVTATTFFGETTASAAATVVWTTGQTIDVTISPTAGGAQYNIYTTYGTVAGTYYLAASNIGGHKYTLQGVLPTGGTQPPTADTGTGSANAYDGMMDIMDGYVSAGTYPAAGYSAGYINQSVASTLTNAVLFDAASGLWDNSSSLNTSTAGGFRADPVELIGEGLDLSNFAANVLANAAGGQQAYQLHIDQDEVGSTISGAAVSQIVNPITRSLIKTIVHPYLQQGNAFLMSYNLPQSFSNVSNAWEVTNVQDYISISWPVIDVTFRYSLFLYGALVGIAPQFSGRLGGLQRTGSTTGGNWS
jgi:hypothetical protein